jgi:quercetin dioxygenase-like cupin family protein
MGTVKQSENKPHSIAKGRTRYLAHTDNVMVVVVDFNDGPAPEPDPPHSHPHEQVSYVASGEIILIIGEEKTHLIEGDLFTVPANVPHTVQTLNKHVRLIDAFNPIREDFLRRPIG